MKGFLNILNLGFLPSSADLGILLLRLGTGVGMVYLHGWNKLMKRTDMAKAFVDPLKLGSTEVSFYLLLFAEVVCAILIACGLLTRLAALVLAFAMGVAFFISHGATLPAVRTGEVAKPAINQLARGKEITEAQGAAVAKWTSMQNAELAAWFGLASLAIFLTGPGKFSIDGAGEPKAETK